jgi:hypothetical protein
MIAREGEEERIERSLTPFSLPLSHFPFTDSQLATQSNEKEFLGHYYFKDQLERHLSFWSNVGRKGVSWWLSQLQIPHGSLMHRAPDWDSWTGRYLTGQGTQWDMHFVMC